MTMIFVTTGTQFPFDRLLKTIDDWSQKNPHVKVIAQTCKSQLEFKNIETKEFLTPSEYSRIVSEASLIIGHAGMGTIITAHENNLPIIIMPRKFSLGEHRNDHQMSTVSKFEDSIGVYVATNNEEMSTLLGNMSELKKSGEFESTDRTKLIDFLKTQIHL